MKRIVPITLAVAMFMENMDATVIATSLPAIAADIGTSPVALKLAFTAYLVALAIFIPISSWMADRFGAKRVFSLAIVVFVLGSVACAFAGSLQEFVLARFFKGMGGAMMTPLARLILFRSVPRSDLVSAMAWLTVPALVAPTVGPPIGGFITTYASWHWIFLINLPIGMIGLVLILRFLPEIEPGPERKLDVPGFFLLGIAFSGIVFGLSLVSLPVLPLWVALTVTGVGILAIIGYGFHAKRAATPLLDPRIFREPAFRSAIAGTAFFLIGVGAMPFLMPLMFQLSFGMTAFETGMVTFVGAFGAMISKFFAKRLYARFGFRNVLLWTLIVASLSMAAMGFVTPQTFVGFIIALLFFNGLIRSFYFTGQHALGLSEIADEEAGQATAISTVTRPIATALGVALAGMVLEWRSHGADPVLADFHVAFFVVTAVSLIGVVPYLLLNKDAGSAVSGHVSERAREEAITRSREKGNDGQSPRF